MINHARTALPVALTLSIMIAGVLWAQKEETIPKAEPGLEAQISKTIVFITSDAIFPGTNGRPARRVVVSGTGFMVSVPDNRLKPGQSFGYLVTNRHVATATDDEVLGQCLPTQILQTYVSMNLKNPIRGNRAEREPLPTGTHWYFPKDEGVDLAVTPFDPNPNKYDIKAIPIKMFITTEDMNQLAIAPGAPVLTAGYFSAYAGLHEIQPIVREGVLAMLPDGPMTATMCKPANLYLADVHVIPGNSGSPIFIAMRRPIPNSPTFQGIQTVFGLLGVVSGYMYEDQHMTLRASAMWNVSIHANSGISTVVPAQQLENLLMSPALHQQRDEAIKNAGASLP